MERTYDQNQAIVYVDPKGERHAALVTAWWGPMGSGTERGCNLVYVTSDPDKRDPYGLQLERATSVCHKNSQPAPGNFWCWSDE